MVTRSSDPQSIASTVLVWLGIGAALIFTFGYRVAVNRRANADYKRTKAALPDMRKAFWWTLWRATKIGFWFFVGIALLITWAFNAEPQP